jgi:hypothetical protein
MSANEWALLWRSCSPFGITPHRFHGHLERGGMSRRQMYRTNPQFDPRREDGVPHADGGPRGSWDPDYIRPSDKLRVAKRRGNQARVCSHANILPSSVDHWVRIGW